MPTPVNKPNLIEQLQAAAATASDYLAQARRVVAERCAPSGKPEAKLMQQHQRALHGLAWSATTVEAHKSELRKYSTSMGTIRFQPDDPLPEALVKKLVKARIAENAAKSA